MGSRFRPAQAAVTAALASIALGRPLLHGSSPVEVATYGTYLLLYVVLPGWLAYRALRGPDDDWLMELGMGWALGVAMQAITYVLLKVVGAPELFVAYPLGLVPLAFWCRARCRAVPALPTSDAPRAWHFAALLTVCAVAAWRTHPVSSAGWWTELDKDMLFHAGNAAELLHHWPLQDPRLAGRPLNYHFLVYALTAGASQVTGMALADVMFRTAVCTLPVLLALQVYNAGRRLGRGHAAGLLAAAVILMHVDVGDEWARIAGEPFSEPPFHSHLNLGIYASTSTLGGLVMLTTLAVVLYRWLVGSEPWTRLAPLLLLVGTVAAGSKGTVMPMVLAGLGGLALWELLRRRSAGNVLGALAIVGVAGLPFTLWLTLGQSSYVGSMFRLAPLYNVRQSDFFRAVAGDSSSSATVWLLAVPWLAGFLGLAGISGLWRMWSARDDTNLAERWAFLTALSGFPPALALVAPGVSQLFFLYNSQLLLATLGGGLILRWLTPRRAVSIPGAVAAWALGVPLLVGSWRAVVAGLQRDATRVREPAIVTEYREGLGWIREHTSPDALFVTNHEFILISVWAERRSFHESTRSTPESLASRWREQSDGTLSIGHPSHPVFGKRSRLRRRAVISPDWLTFRRVGVVAEHVGEVYLLVDNVVLHSRHDSKSYVIGPVPDRRHRLGAAFKLVFENGTLRVYRVEKPH